MLDQTDWNVSLVMMNHSITMLLLIGMKRMMIYSVHPVTGKSHQVVTILESLHNISVPMSKKIKFFSVMSDSHDIDDYYYSNGKSCFCGWRDFDKANQCEECKQWICSRKCAGMAAIVHTNEGMYCSDCLEKNSVVLIYPDEEEEEEEEDGDEEEQDNNNTFNHPPLPSECDKCLRDVYHIPAMHIAGSLICMPCLEIVVKEACNKK